MGWQPIETAPRDGTSILVCGGTWVGDFSGEVSLGGVAMVTFLGSKWAVDNTEYYAPTIRNPTHWMPLPPLPDTPQAQLSGEGAQHAGT